MSYLAEWPDVCYVAETPAGKVMGYVLGKVEGNGENWHGHVTAVTVAPEFRRLGLGRKLMSVLEDVSEKVYDAYFVDLYVRASNEVAIGMYKRFGYSIYRRVLKYYRCDRPHCAIGAHRLTHDAQRRTGRRRIRHAESTA